MEARANDGGRAGPFRRRPFRRPQATPYARPPTALRGEEKGRWISKLVDPASRLIASGASKLFSSVFRKRLTAPPRTPDEVHQSREEEPQVAPVITSSELPDGNKDEKIEKNNADNGGIAELEQLLTQKTFTRIEFERLEELLRSRTIETVNVEHANNDGKSKKASTLAEQVGIGKNLSVPGAGKTILKEIPTDEVASPSELAKAYMGSISTKVSISDTHLHDRVVQEDPNLQNMPSTSKRLDFSVAPRSVIRSSGIREQPANGYQSTPRTTGRSAIYRMSRSPYFKGGELSRDGYSYSSSSHWTPSAMKSGGKQVLKRGSSALDGDLGSFGPIRRIRQKSNLMSPFKEGRVPHSGNVLSSSVTPILKDASRGSLSVQKPLLLEERQNANIGSQPTEKGSSSFQMLPSQSSETAKKLFQQLDRLLPSPAEKSSERKTIDRDESPSMLTPDMLKGSALRSTEDVKLSQLFNTEGVDNLAAAGELSDSKRARSEQLDIVDNNGRSKPFGQPVKLVPKANGMSNAPTSIKDAKPSLNSANIAVSSSAVLPEPKRPGFQMSAPEDSLELDDDDYNTRVVSKTLTGEEDDAKAKISKGNDVIPKTKFSEEPLQSPSLDVSVPSSTLLKKAEKKASIQPVITGKENGFAFPFPSEPLLQSQPPPTPTMPAPELDKPVAQKEQMTSVFTFGSKAASSPTFSSLAHSVNDTEGIKFGVESRSALTSNSSSVTTTLTDGSSSDKSEVKKSVSFGLPASSTPASSLSFGLSNGSSQSSSPAFSLPAKRADTLSQLSSTFVNNTGSNSSSSSSSITPAAATFSTGTSFQSGSIFAPVSVSQPSDTSPNVPEVDSIKGMSSSAVEGTSAAPRTSSSSPADDAPSVALSGCSGLSPTYMTSPMSSSLGGNSLSTTSLFSSMVGTTSTVAQSSPFPSTGGNNFAFAASIQSTGSNLSLANTSQITSAPTFGATNASTSLSPSFAGNSSYNSGNTFGATGGLMFGSQSTQSGSGTSQNSSPLGSFSSSPFGLNNSSTGSFGISAFGSETSGAKAFSSSTGFSFSAGASSAGAGTGLLGSSSQASTSSILGSSSQASKPSIFGSSTSPAGSLFGLPASGSNSSPFTFGSLSSSPVFPFASVGDTASSTPSSTAPVFGMPNPASGFGSGSPANDQMNVEDSMTDDTNQAPTTLVPSFGQPTNPSTTPSFPFAAPAVQTSVPSFQFGGSQTPVLQNPSPFQSTGSLELPGGGGFSVGSSGAAGDKSGRRFIRVKGNKVRKK